MKWLRLYNEVLDDPKVQQLHPALFKHWINLLCLASQLDQDGELPDERAIAFRLRLRPAECRKVLDQLCAAGLLDCDENATKSRTLSAHNWSGRQRNSDNIAQRVAKHRAGNGENVTLPVTPVKHDGNVLDTDTERDTEKDRANARAAPVPEGNPTQALIDAWAERRGFPPSNWGKAGRQAKSLVEAGVTPAELMDIYDYLEADPFWSDGKGFDLGTALSQVDKFRQSKRTPKARPKSRSEKIMENAEVTKQMLRQRQNEIEVKEFSVR